MRLHGEATKGMTEPTNEKDKYKFGFSGIRMIDGSPEIQHIQPNETSLAIVRLFLEKLETLTADERKEILTVIRYLNAPMVIFKARTEEKV
jgi:hypothetical protein